MSLGKCPRPKLFKAYAELELQLGEIERCRKIYEKQVQLFVSDSEAWVAYAEFEWAIGEIERARSIFELVIGEKQPQIILDMPERVWKAYIDSEIDFVNKNGGLFDKARNLYQKLLSKSKHVKVWASFA